MQKINITKEEFNKLENKKLVLKGKRPMSLGDTLFINKEELKEHPSTIFRWEHTEYYKIKEDYPNLNLSEFDSVTLIHFL